MYANNQFGTSCIFLVDLNRDVLTKRGKRRGCQMPENIQGTGSEARLLTDERFLRKVAYLYYEDGHSQETIAEMEYCSRQTVSKALQKAKDRSIVRIAIVPDLRTGFLRNLSREVRVQLGLEDLVLVAGHNMNMVT